MEEPRSMTIAYSDLDLARPEGAQTLYRRIASAARYVCGPVDNRQLRSYRSFRDCVQDAVDEAVRQIDRGTLTALHRQQAGRPPIG